MRPSLALGTLSSLVAAAAAVAIARSDSLAPRSLLAVLVVAGAVILLSFRPEALLVSWLGLAPLLQEFGSHRALEHPLGLALYQAPPLVFLLWTLTAPTRVRSLGVARRPGFVDVLPAAYFLFVLGSLLFSAQVSATSLKYVYVSTGIGVILYYFLAFGPLSLAPSRVVRVLLALAILEAVMSIIDGLTRWNLWHDTTWQQGTRSRAVATLGDPASLGAFIGMGIVLALCILVWNGPPQLRRLAVGTVAVGLPGLFFTITRGPIVATVIAASLVLLSRTGSRLLTIGVLALTIVVIVLSWSRITSSTLYQDRVSRANTVEIRVELQRLSLTLAKERPLFGWGYGSFDRVARSADFGSRGPLSRAEVISSTSHNTFLTILVQYGSIGLALFVVPWLVIGGRALAGAIAIPDSRWLLLGCVSALVVYAFTANAIDFRFFSFVPAVPWLLLGLLRRRLSSVQEV